ncbi:MAG TPA: hypothetical protein VMU08_02475 [Rhizomicrobium sp.]|nr:hypothetical protein [Rhizomicrobium sp.]
MIRPAWKGVTALVLLASAASILLTRIYDSDRATVLEDRIGALNEQLEMYRDRLGGASPDEAQAKIAALQAQIDKLSTPTPVLHPNPLETSDAKWGLAKNLQGFPAKDCELVIVSLPTNYAEHLGADLKSVLQMVGLKYREQLATATVPSGLFLRSEETGPSRDCANSLFSILNGSNLAWSKPGASGNFGTGLDYFSKESKEECAGATMPCVRITVGNEPP